MTAEESRDQVAEHGLLKKLISIVIYVGITAKITLEVLEIPQRIESNYAYYAPKFEWGLHHVVTLADATMETADATMETFVDSLLDAQLPSVADDTAIAEHTPGGKSTRPDVIGFGDLVIAEAKPQGEGYAEPSPQPFTTTTTTTSTTTPPPDEYLSSSLVASGAAPYWFDGKAWRTGPPMA